MTDTIAPLRWLEFETVLGPEDDGETAKKKLSQQLAAPAQNLLGGSSAAATDPEKAVGAEPEAVRPAKTTDLAIQGELSFFSSSLRFFSFSVSR